MIDWTGESQQRETWLQWRGKGIGSSDMPIIMGVSPWKSIYKLWLEKTGQEKDDFKGNWATARGNRLEPLVRNWYNDKYQTKMEPKNFEHKEFNFFRSSLDGFDESINRAIEIKCPSVTDHQCAVDGNVPEKYLPQVHWLMFVSGCDSLDYVSYNEIHEQEYAVVTIKPDLIYREELKDKALLFWKHVQDKTPPDLPTHDSENEIFNKQELENLLLIYEQITKDIDELERKKEELINKIKFQVKGEKAKFNNYSMAWTKRIGAVDYSKIEVLKNIDLNQYRKESTTYFTVKKLKTV